MGGHDSIGRALAEAASTRIDAMLTEALVGHGNVAPDPDAATLTIDTVYAAYDRLWDLPDESHWYLCHPDKLAWVRSVVGADAPGKHTCPIVRASDWCPPGKVIRVAWDAWAKAGARRQGR